MGKSSVDFTFGPRNDRSTEEVTQLIDKHIELRQQRFEHFKEVNEMFHRHLIDTTDKFSEYGQTFAKECRTTVDQLQGNCMEFTDKVRDILKDNKDLAVPLAKVAVAPVVAGVLGIAAVVITRQSGYKEKVNHITGKTKIRIR